MLKKQYPSIKSATEHAKVAEINPEGRAGLGYDIEYIDENGNRRFVEVKASKTSDIVFYMSDNEFDFAIKHITEYIIYFVTEVFSKKPKILLIDNVFKGNDFILITLPSIPLRNIKLWLLLLNRYRLRHLKG
jgi:hypothetical protein